MKILEQRICLLLVSFVALLGVYHISPEECSSPYIFDTHIPIYYINLAENEFRNYVLKYFFGNNKYLKRVAAINGFSDFSQYIGFGGAINITNYSREVRAEPCEIGITFSHFKAIYTALYNGNDVAIIVEDDISPILIPFWDNSLDNSVDAVSQAYDDWFYARLQYALTQFSTMKSMLRIQSFAKREFSTVDVMEAFDVGAYALNSKAMEMIVNKYIDKDGKFDCRQQLDYMRCVADILLPLEFHNRHFLIHPVKFVPRIINGSVRLNTQKFNRFYYAKILDAIRSSLEKYRSRRMQILYDSCKICGLGDIFQYNEAFPSHFWDLQIVA